MPRPENGIYIIMGEANLVVTAMRRNSRWSSHSHQDDDQDPLITSFSQLKDILNTVSDLDELAPNEFLSPFLEVIRSEDTTGPITGLALTSINKFLSYGLIDPSCETAAAAIENIADAVTHARFVGTDPGSDEVVLMKILHVLRTLLLTPAGAQLTNESVCEIMQSCFRITFEMRLSELLRRSAEHTLMDMVQLLFSRLPQFKEDAKWAINMKKLKMRAGGMDPRGTKKRRSPKPKHRRSSPSQTPSGGVAAASGHQPQTNYNSGAEYEAPALDGERQDQYQGQGPEVLPATTDSGTEIIGEEEAEVLETLNANETMATTPVAAGTTVVDIHESFKDASELEAEERAAESFNCQSELESTQHDEQCSTITADTDASTVQEDDSAYKSGTIESNSQIDSDLEVVNGDQRPDLNSSVQSLESQGETSSTNEEYINPRGVRFTQQQQQKDGTGPLIPYGLPCVRELFRFLISLTNPIDRHNTDVMTHMGLSLLTVALESGADHISSFSSLLSLVRDDLCKNLFFLLQTERLSLFAASVRVCFLLFESMRSHLKFQLENYLIKLQDIIVSESMRISYEQREIALESVVQLLRIPGLVTELYLNYDCDLYCTNLFEDLMKLLSKNAFPVSGLFTTHLLSLDALLAVIDSIEQHCHHRVLHSAKTGDSDQTDSPPRFMPDVQSSMDTESIGETSDAAPPPPPTVGFAMADQMDSGLHGNEMGQEIRPKQRENRKGPQIRPNRMKVTDNIPTEEDLLAIKHKKKVYQTGTEQFNVKPSKGVAYMQEQGLLSTPLDPGEIVTFIKENPKLEKKQIGEYLSIRKNKQVLDAYNKSFVFSETRIDEALRMYLESFRLPGEAPVISYILESFSDHWHKLNGEPFHDCDAAFTLGYAVIMLNVDQHNHNAKKQNIPMTVHDFKRNLKGVNGGKNFEQEMLEEIFTSVKNDEIIMPAEQTGLVKENYLWRVLLRRGATKDGLFIHAPTGRFDRDLFSLVWGPTVAALSFVFDKSLDETIIQKAISGFRKCAMISAHYGLSDVFDNLVISLCKFTTLLSQVESAETIPVQFGNNLKAQLAAKTVFGLAHRHGDILREGWKNILDCQLQLYRAKMLPDLLTKVEDFVDPEGRISLVREEVTTAKADTGVLSSFYSYFTLAEPVATRGPSAEEQEAIRQAHRCIQECHVEQLITESKFLREDSLHELLKALMFASRCPEQQETLSGNACDEDAAVFFLELLIKVVLQNRDRVTPFWQNLRDHIYNLAVNAAEHSFLVERAVVGLLRLAIRLLRREEIAPQVLASLRILLMMKPQVIHSVSRQVAYGLHDLLKTNAANIHSSQDWYTLFTLLEVCGAGTNPPPLMQVTAGINVPESISDAGAQSDSEISMGGTTSPECDRGYTSDSEIYEASSKHSAKSSIEPLPSVGSWLLVNREDIENGRRPTPINQYNIILQEELKHHDTRALLRSCETLAFLVRDAAHITPHNFESCVHTIRTFVEASINGGGQSKQKKLTKDKRGPYKSKGKNEQSMTKSKSLACLKDAEEEQENDGYHSLSIQLLDLMHTLHTRAATIFSSWAEEEKERRAAALEARPPPYLEGTPETIDAATSSLWTKCWCPLLQGIARLCCDSRRQVRSQALTYLQRALLVHDLQTLSAVEWESCFNKVLFPLLSKLLDVINSSDPSGIEETRMRASTLLCKVFLQHLSPLLSLSTFTALWLTILDFMDRYMHADRSDLLSEAIPESLKNMLLVMNTAGILQGPELETSQLWKLTWDRIDTFLPNLRNELFQSSDMDMRRSQPSTPCEPPQQPGIPRNQSPPPPRPAHSPSSTSSPSPPPPPTSTTASPEKSSPTHSQNESAPTGEVGSPASKTGEASTADQVRVGAGSPLTVPESVTTSTSYILHPPLPHVPTPVSTASLPTSVSPATAVTSTDTGSIVHGQTTVPILLNPDLMKGTSIPIISPQKSADAPEMAATEAR